MGDGWMEHQHMSADYVMRLPDICSQWMVGGGWWVCVCVRGG